MYMFKQNELFSIQNRFVLDWNESWKSVKAKRYASVRFVGTRGSELSSAMHNQRLIIRIICIYSAFANSCPLQTDTFLFPLIHSHNVILSSNKF